MKPFIGRVAVVALAALPSLAFAVGPDSVPEPKRTTLGLYLSSQEAYEIASREKVLFVDVRSRAEVNFLGIPTVADANIPYMDMDPMYNWDEKKGVFKLDHNSAFVTEIADRLAKKGLDKDAKIVVMCRSGDRSANAANLLAKAGYRNVYSIVDGFEGDIAKDGPQKGQRAVNGWKNAKLPWSYQLNRDKMYFEH